MADQTTLKEALIKKFTFIQSQNTFFKEAFKEDDYNSLTNYDYRCIYDFYKKKIETVNMLIESMPERLKQYINL